MPLIIAIAAVAFVAYLVAPPAFPFLQTDSMSYVNFEPMRTPGYPLFLAFVAKLFGGLQPAAPIQLFAMIASAAYLSLELRQLTHSTLLAAAALLLIVGNLFIYRYAFTIMSEALFFAALAVIVGLICRFAARPGRGTIAALSCAIAVCILIRPVAYVFVPILLLCAAVGWRRDPRPLRLALAAALPAALVLAAGSFVYYGHHGSFRTQSFLGHNLIGKVAYLPGTDVASRYPEIDARINGYMDPRRSVRIDNLSDRFLFQERHYDHVRYRLTTPAIERIAAETGAAADDIRKDVALAFIEAHPLAFAEEVGLQLYALWTVAELRTAADNRRFEGLLASLSFDPFKDMATPHRTPMPWPAVYGIRAFVLGILAATLVGFIYGAVALARRRPISPAWAALIQISFLLHAYIGLVALLQAGLFRYLIVLWPAIVAAAALFAHAALGYLRSAQRCNTAGAFGQRP
jgi:hypothetical protein